MFEVLKKCFAINLNDYENISFSLEINKVVFGASIALIIGIILLNAYRGNIRYMIMQLQRHGATSEDNAKKLSELGLDKVKIIRYLLSGENMLTKIVARVGEAKYSYDEYISLDKKERAAKEKINFNTASFYLREDQTDRCAVILEKYNISAARTALACLFVAIVCVCIIACMPGILNIIDNILEGLKSK